MTTLLALACAFNALSAFASVLAYRNWKHSSMAAIRREWFAVRASNAALLTEMCRHRRVLSKLHDRLNQKGST